MKKTNILVLAIASLLTVSCAASVAWESFNRDNRNSSATALDEIDINHNRNILYRHTVGDVFVNANMFQQLQMPDEKITDFLVRVQKIQIHNSNYKDDNGATNYDFPALDFSVTLG
jgi:hypothetical protein